MRIAAAVILLLSAALVGSGCSTTRRVLQTPGSTIHSLVMAETIAWETQGFEAYARDFENRIDAGEQISPAEYNEFVRAERMHWHVFRKTEQ